MKKYITPERISALIIEFVFYGLIGWIYETVLTSIVWGQFAERGVLHLPILPIYGLFGLVLRLILGRIRNIPLLFVVGTVFITIAELIASYVLELFTDKKLWDYYEWAFNFDGRISLYSSLIFGAMCVILVKLAYPFIKMLSVKIKKKPLIITGFSLLGAMLADLMIVLIFGK